MLCLDQRMSLQEVVHGLLLRMDSPRTKRRACESCDAVALRRQRFQCGGSSLVSASCSCFLHHLREPWSWLSDLLLYTTCRDQLSGFRVSHFRHFDPRRSYDRSYARGNNLADVCSAADWKLWTAHTRGFQRLLAPGHHSRPDLRLLPDLFLPQYQIRWQARLYPVRQRRDQSFRSNNRRLERQRGRGRYYPPDKSRLLRDRVAGAVSYQHF